MSNSSGCCIRRESWKRPPLELEAVRRRWGSLMVVDEMTLAVTADDPQARTRALKTAVERSPSSLDLLTLAWRNGETPFFQPYRLSLNEVVTRVDDDIDGVDAVLLLDQAVERVFDDGSSLYYYHGVTRALTPVGARQASRLQQLPDSYRLKVRIHKEDGSVVVPADLGAERWRHRARRRRTRRSGGRGVRRAGRGDRSLAARTSASLCLPFCRFRAGLRSFRVPPPRPAGA